MAYNKIIFGDQTLIDLTEDTVTAEDVMAGKVLHTADGNQATGTFSLDTELANQDSLITQIREALIGKTAGGALSEEEINALVEAKISELSQITLDNFTCETNASRNGNVITYTGDTSQSIYMTVDPSKTYVIRYNAIGCGFISFDDDWNDKGSVDADGEHSITVSGASSWYFYPLDTADGEYMIYGLYIVEAGSEGSDPILQNKDVTITQNGSTTITPDDGYDGLSSVDVDVDIQPRLQTRYMNLTENGHRLVEAMAGYDALEAVDITVNVPIPDGYIQPSGTLDIVENGTKDVTNYASVNVNVPTPEPNLYSLGYDIDHNATYNLNAPNGYDGLASPVTVRVNVPTPEATVNIGTTTATGAGSTSISFTGLQGQPKMFEIHFESQFNSSSTRVVTSVSFDGTTTHGTWMYQSSNKSWGINYHSTSYFTWTYSNGTLTVNTSSSTNGGVFRSTTTYKLVYVY